MSDDKEVMIGKYTRREFREAMAAGKFQAAIVATAATEQHLEHLAMEHDLASVTTIAREVAKRLYPQVIVFVPMALGISEHHMVHKGSMTAKPGSWLSVLFDAVEGMVRHGVKNVLILNGHGGNEAPMKGILRQWQLYFNSTAPEVNVQFHSYWNLSREVAEQHCTSRVPGHAQEYETSMALAMFPENVRRDAMRDQEDQEPLKATVEKGRIFVEAAISKTVEYLQEMIAGKHREVLPHVFSKDLDMKK
ncbi:MAG: creatininase family protein [Candidatus Latescibacteria bacterium]|nr:creatininase family protein [Candidatus Latescibacterota bacterium]